MAVFKSRADAIVVPGQYYDPGNDTSIDENNSSPTNPIRRVNPNIVDKLFDKAVNGNMLESLLAKGALTAADIASDYFGVSQPAATPNSAVAGSSFGLPTISLPKLEY
jgi:hypothetical protein